MKKFGVILPLALTLLGFAATSALSQQQASTISTQNVVEESFDGNDPSLMLGGQLDLLHIKAPWYARVTSGRFVLENRDKPKSLHYNDIAWVKFPGSSAVESTEGFLISAVVESENVGSGGVGFIVGSGKIGVYLAFAVDGQGRYHVFEKNGKSLRPVYTAKHPAIAIGEPNKLSFEKRGPQVVFFANGTELLETPLPTRLASPRGKQGQAGVGLAAFGIGTFYFESVAIEKAN